MFCNKRKHSADCTEVVSISFFKLVWLFCFRLQYLYFSRRACHHKGELRKMDVQKFPLRIAVYHYGYQRELFIVQKYINIGDYICYLLPQRRKTKSDERQVVDLACIYLLTWILGG